MVKVLIACFAALCLALATSIGVAAESKDISFESVDPRQYVALREARTLKKRAQVIWTYTPSSQPQPLRLHYLDIDACVQITFDQSALAANENLAGNLSVAARINNRSIEVAPYSVVGEERARVGVSAKSSKEIALSFIGMIEQLGELRQALDGLNEKNQAEGGNSTWNVGGADSRAYVLKSLGLLAMATKGPEGAFSDSAQVAARDTLTVATAMQRIPSLAGELLSISSFYHSADLRALLSSPEFVMRYRVSQLIALLREMSEPKDSTEASRRVLYDQRARRGHIDRLVDLSLRYIEFFRGSGVETEQAFLTMLSLDRTYLVHIQEQLLKLQAFGDGKAPANVAEQEYVIIASELKAALGRFVKASRAAMNYEKSTASSVATEEDTSSVMLARRLANRAGAIIFQKLVLGTIDLRKEDAQEGDILYVSLLWYGAPGAFAENGSVPKSAGASDGMRSVLEGKALELPVMAFRIKQAGWRTKVVDSFFVIKRNVRPTGVDRVGAAESNFKGAPGVSLMRGYSNPHTARLNDSAAGAIWSVVATFEPSYGLNVSYVDFENEKDFELGVGGVLGLFRNQLMLTIGADVHARSKRWYYGLGFSFADLAHKAGI